MSLTFSDVVYNKCSNVIRVSYVCDLKTWEFEHTVRGYLKEISFYKLAGWLCFRI